MIQLKESTDTDRSRDAKLPTFQEFQRFRKEKEQERRDTFVVSKRGRKSQGRVKVCII